MRLIAADAAAIIPSMAEIVLFHHALGLTSGVLAFAGPFAGRVEGLPAELVDAGFSLGLVPAQKLAQTRPGALGADIDAARAIVEEADDGELFLYPGDAHTLQTARCLRTTRRHPRSS